MEPIKIKVICDVCGGEVKTDARNGLQTHVEEPETEHSPVPRAAGNR